MPELKLLCQLLICAVILQCIDNLDIKINVSGKSKPKTYQEACARDSDCGYGLSCILLLAGKENNFKIKIIYTFVINY